MRVIVMDRISFTVVSLSEVTSITYSDGNITIVGKNDSTGLATTVNTNSTRSLVRIMES